MGDSVAEMFQEALPNDLVPDLSHKIRALDISASVNLLHWINWGDRLAVGTEPAAGVFGRQRCTVDKAAAKDKLQKSWVFIML